MTIETKFNVNETIYFIRRKEIYQGTVNKIVIDVKETINITYWVKYVELGCNEITHEKENEIANSLENLSKLLIDNFKNKSK